MQLIAESADTLRTAAATGQNWQHRRGDERDPHRWERRLPQRRRPRSGRPGRPGGPGPRRWSDRRSARTPDRRLRPRREGRAPPHARGTVAAWDGRRGAGPRRLRRRARDSWSTDAGWRRPPRPGDGRRRGSGPGSERLGAIPAKHSGRRCCSKSIGRLDERDEDLRGVLIEAVAPEARGDQAVVVRPDRPRW